MAKAGEFKFFFRVWLGATDEDAISITIFYPELEVVDENSLPYEEWFLNIAEQYDWETQRVKLQLDPTRRYQLVGQAVVISLPAVGPFDAPNEEFDVETCKAAEVSDEYYEYLTSLE